MAPPRIAPCLWFDNQAEEAANFYTSVFKDSKIKRITRYPDAGTETHHQPPGKVMTVEFDLDGLSFTALNGGPDFRFNEAVSMQKYCKDQAEIDYYWEKLGAGGDPMAQMCGWLKDRFGLSWQIVPEGMDEMYKDHTSPNAQRVMSAMLKMKKLDVAELKRAYDGK